MSTLETSAVVVDPGRIELQQFPIPDVGPDDGVLKVEVAGVCGSDPSNFKNRPRPLILGHEITGIVHAIGDRSAARWGVKAGDRIVVETYFGCGLCRWCAIGQYRYCQEKLGYGANIPASRPPYLWGAYGQYLYIAPTARVHKVPDGMTPDTAVMVCAVLGNGIRWLRTIGGVSVGDTVAIVGPGPQGLAATVAAHHSGAGKIIVIGLARDEARMAFARRLGATHLIYSDREDPVQAVAEITDGKMARVTLDVAGGPETGSLAIRLGGIMSSVVIAAGGRFPNTLPMDIIYKEQRITGVYTHDTPAVEQALELAASGKYPLHEMVTHRFSLADAERAVRTVAGEFTLDGFVKAVLDPNL